MTDDDRTRNGKGSAGEDASDDATRIRPRAAQGPTRKDDEDDATKLRDPAAVEPDAPADDDDEAPTLFRAPADDAGEPPADDADEPTLFRASPASGTPAASADDDDGADDPTRFRTPAPGGGDDDEEATQFRGLSGDADEDEATRFRSPPDSSDTTEINRNVPGAAAEAEDATRMRVGTVPDDEDPTIAAGDARLGDALVNDDDATVQAGATRFTDDDETVQGGGAPAGARPPPVGDDDATVQGGATASPRPSPRKAPAQAARTGAQAAASLGIGTVLKGRFTLEDKLGAGGMGGVFKAVDLVKQEARDRNPYVAVKVMNESFADHPDAFIALQRESSRTQRLSHPNIASVYDFDRDGDVAYMIMEMLEGDPLDKHLKSHKNGLDPEVARGIIRDISSALAYAHAQGLIHSDFKPGNIFWTKSGIAKVFDFGIARAAATGEDPIVGGGPVDIATLEKDDGSDKTLFDAGKLGALTPAYAALEMFEGRDPAPQDDVYALGIVAYQCLTGKHPFNRQKAPVAEAKNMVPERPDGLTRREWNAIRHALAFRREDRTPDAQAFLDEFFGVTGQAVRAALVTFGAMAAIVGGLYWAGILGPSQQIDTPPEWVQLDTRIEGARSGVATQLAQAETIEAQDQFVAWEGIIRNDIGQWQQIASPRIVIGDFPTAKAALEAREQAYDQAGIALRPLEAANADGSWSLAAGPFVASPEKGTVAAQQAAMEEQLQALGLPYVVERDDEAIESARDAALTVYLEEIERRLPKSAPPEVQLVDPPRDPETGEFLRNGTFTVAPAFLTAIADGYRQIESAEQVLARADNFPTRPDDIAAMTARVQAVRDRWTNRAEEATRVAAARSRGLAATQTVQFNEQLLQNGARDLLQAKREGLTNDDRSELVPLTITVRAARGGGMEQVTSTHWGVFPTFRQDCDDPGRIDSVLPDLADLAPVNQNVAIQYAYDCMREKLTQSTSAVLDVRDRIVAAVDPTKVNAVDLDNLRRLERPDPCGNRGYVGFGRDAFCLDPLASGGTAPAVVVVPGETRDGTYGIGKYEVSIGDYNQFCRATGCERLSGPERLPATGIGPDEARAYLAWLSAQTGRTYRLPTLAEWRRAAAATDGGVDANRNCYSNVRGVVRGEELISVGQGAPNAWGLINHVGNAEEWVTVDGGIAAAGGRHTDPLAQCNVESLRRDVTAAGESTGFRVLREVATN
ncbi:MAG TPA: bifunctional serine/threonine-protein kinase/formylglycine-generating enzyme family protein [Pseudomonadales bacterium]|nr:bifunctional serine/threonine-protein kinase/formylglycine-generating enzyme family protein [Pseudomonadales bacterium]